MRGFNFTKHVREALAYAREEAVVLHHEYVGTEHILLGLLRDRGNVAVRIVTTLGADPAAVREQVLEIVKRGTGVSGPDLPYTSRAKKVLEFAMEECAAFDHPHVGTEHVLLGLLVEGKGIGGQVLLDHGIALAAARDELRRIAGAPAAEAERRRERETRHFPRRIREILARAYDVATERQSVDLTIAHVAMALLEHDGGFARAALERLDFDFVKALATLDRQAEHGAAPIPGDGIVQPTAEVTQALRGMERLAETSSVSAPGTQHLLVALLHESAPLAAVFAEQGATLAKIGEEIARMTG